MSNLGIGVMLHMLTDHSESANAFQESIGKTIKGLWLVDNELRFDFEDGSRIKLFDDGQSCCEYRYMHTDDTLSDFIGAKLMDADVRDGGSIEGEYDCYKESQFLIVTTSLGQFTVVNYNEHNGYYGGFALLCERIE
jgi:hypothetical protein